MTVIGKTDFSLINIFCKYYIVAFFLLIPPHSIKANELGRLFTTPQQREILENIRHQKQDNTNSSNSVIDKISVVKKQTPVLKVITVNGIVYRENGRNTTWINGKGSYEGDIDNQQLYIEFNKIKPDDAIVILPTIKGSLSLKPGEKYIINTTEVPDLVF